MVSETENMTLHILDPVSDLWDLFMLWHPLDLVTIDAHDHSEGKGVQVDHADLANIGTNAHSVIDSHIGNVTTNPHAVTKTNVGLSAVTNDAQVKASEKGAVSGVATLNASSMVVQDPASASATPGNAVIPIAGADGTIAAGFLPPVSSTNPLLVQVFS
jgi:hypothetical protein